MLSLGITCLIALATVSPPIPESNMQMGLLFIKTNVYKKASFNKLFVKRGSISSLIFFYNPSFVFTNESMSSVSGKYNNTPTLESKT